MEGVYEKPETLMTPEEIERIVKILLKYGVNKVKLTGGEPMLRRDILEIVERLGRLKLRDLSMTTNGTRLPSLAGKLRKAGLRRVNISLHSVDPSKFCWITGLHNIEAGKKRFEYTLKAIKAAIQAGLRPVKLNVVIMRGVNEDEVDRLIEFTRKLGGGDNVILQLIELVQEGYAGTDFFERYFYSLGEIEERIGAIAEKVVVRELQLRRQYRLPGNVWVEFVRPMNNCSFCMNNNRIRITHDGKFKPCLMRDDNHVDFLTAMRNGAGEEELERLFLKAVYIREPYWKPKNLKPARNITFVQEFVRKPIEPQC